MQYTTLNQLKQWRRHLHQYPELSLQEFKTSQYIRDELAKMRLEYMTPLDTATLVYLDVGAKQTILLRADIDALPIQEQVDVPFKSTIDGAMHACGHDGHTAMLLGAINELNYLKQHNQLHVNVLAVFQPAEETFGGGELLIQQFDFSPYHITAAFALHVNPDYNEGEIATRSGELMASCREFDVTITGKSAHVGLREQGINAMNAGAQIFQQFQAIPTYHLDAKHTNIIHVGTFQSGEAVNVVPNFASLKGTIRTYSQEDLSRIQTYMQHICDGVAMSTQTNVSLTFGEGYPAVINDDKLIDYSRQASKHATFILQDDPYLMAEDFSFYQQIAPINYSFVGIRNDELQYVSGLHTPTLQFREEALIYGVDYFVQLAQLFGGNNEKCSSHY